MDIKEIKIGKWYKIVEYGFCSGIKGKCVDIVGDYVILKFYWGNPFRTRKSIEAYRILEECKKPSLFSNY